MKVFMWPLVHFGSAAFQCLADVSIIYLAQNILQIIFFVFWMHAAAIQAATTVKQKGLGSYISDSY